MTCSALLRFSYIVHCSHVTSSSLGPWNQHGGFSHCVLGFGLPRVHRIPRICSGHRICRTRELQGEMKVWYTANDTHIHMILYRYIIKIFVIIIIKIFIIITIIIIILIIIIYILLNFTSSWDFVIFREYWISRSRCNIWCSVRAQGWHQKT